MYANIYWRICEQHSYRREITRLRRHDNPRDLECPCELDAVQRSAATIAKQRKIARIVPAGDRDFFDYRSHREISDRQHAFGRTDIGFSPS